MPGLVPGIHVFLVRRFQNVDGRTSPAMTTIYDGSEVTLFSHIPTMVR